MKGLYVYGALLMAMGFVAGLFYGLPAVAAAAAASCASAALSEAMDEVLISLKYIKRYPAWLGHAQMITAIMSWLLTAGTALMLILALISLI